MPERDYSWDDILAGLKRIAAKNPEFLPNTVLVGGAACWYYRLALKRADDPHFRVPSYSPEEERIWLSKDLDFMGDSAAEISQIIGQPCPPMGTLIKYAGATLDFIDQGVKITAEAANRTARKARADGLEFYIISPSLLFAEKHACTLQKNRPQDPLHREAVARFIKMELCRNLESPVNLDNKEWLNEAKEVKTADIQFFALDLPFRRRLHSAASLLAPQYRAILHWVRHHVPSSPTKESA